MLMCRVDQQHNPNEKFIECRPCRGLVVVVVVSLSPPIPIPITNFVAILVHFRNALSPMIASVNAIYSVVIAALNRQFSCNVYRPSAAPPTPRI